MKKNPYLVLLAVVLLSGALVIVGRYVFSVGFLVSLLGCALLLLCWWRLLSLLQRRQPAARWARVLKRITAAALALLLVSFISVESLIVSNADGDAAPQAEVLIVLGAGLRGETLSLALLYRLDAACQYLNDHPQAVAVLTGSQGPLESISEAEAMRRYLVEKGIDDSRLLPEDQADNTIENIAYSKALLVREGLADKPLAVVSNTFHLYRVRRICARQGLTVQTIAAPVPQVGLVPLNCYLREYASVMLLYTKELLGVKGA